MKKLKYAKIIDRMRLEDKIALCSGADNWTTKSFGAYGIPSIWVADGPHGVRKQEDGGDEPGAGKSVPATCFPTACTTACSWDRNLMLEIGEALGEEALQEGVSILLGPGLNIKRNPLCGRNFEYFSEDPYLGGVMAEHWIKGVHRKGIGVSVKHFAANNQENLRMQSDSIMDERTLHEIYLAGFEIVVKNAQPETVMCAYNKINGTYCSDHEKLLRRILREEWGFDGVIVTDWGAMNDRILAFKAGLDLEMPGGIGFYDLSVMQAIESGELSEGLLDESVDRLLEIIFAGHERLDGDFRYDAEAHHQLARKAAAQSMVLLKNEGRILPISKERRIAVIGSLAQHPRYQGAGSSFLEPITLESTLDGFDAYQANYSFYPGYVLKGPQQENLLAEAVAGAGNCDVALVFIGLTEEEEAESFDRKNMSLPRIHNELVAAVAAVNPNTVVILSGGAPVEMPWLSEVKTVLNTYLAGQAGGPAIADILFGAANPCGKLAESYPQTYKDVPSAGFFESGGKQAQYREGIYVGYRYYDTADVKVAFPFGFGLSYTEFEYRDLQLSQDEIGAVEGLTVSAVIRNSGFVDGAEIVQLYVKDLSKAVYRPEKELKGFTKVFLKSGEEKQVTFELDQRSFAVYDPARAGWVVPGGDYAICLAASSRDIRLQEVVKVDGVEIGGDAPPIPQWYQSPCGKPSPSDFETLLGRKIEPNKALRKGEYTLDCSLAEMRGSFVVRQVIKYAERTVGGKYGGVDYGNPNFLMALESAIGIPLRKLVPLSSGEMPLNAARAIVHVANGHFWRALKALLGK